MKAPIGKINRLSLLILALVVAAIVAGLVVPGSTGKWIEVGGWLAFAAIVLLEVGERGRTLWLGNRPGDDQRDGDARPGYERRRR